MTKDITVASSGLSALQKRVLAYARQRTLDQAIPHGPVQADDGVTVCRAAPDWLDTAMRTSIEKVLHARRTHILDGEFTHGSQFSNFFAEVLYVVSAIETAAKEAGQDGKGIDILRLDKLSGDNGARLLLLPVLLTKGVSSIHYVTPVWEGGRTFFRMLIKGSTEAEVTHSLSHIPNNDTWVEPSPPQWPIVCTIPEMLRDLYGFPVRDGGDIDALAFDTAAIGQQKYNAVNAALRRACHRMHHRGLIAIRSRRPWWSDQFTPYRRSGIGLTDEGITVAESLSPPTTRP
jgi:hypothetical protein